jgi:hypothetical protein
MKHRRLAAACLTAILSVGATSCGGRRGAPSVPTAVSYNPQVAPSVAAYLAFIRATDVARKHPPSSGRPVPGSAADFSAYAVDPVRTQTVSYLAGLHRSGTAWRGTPPKSKVAVLSIMLDAKPYPTVTLGDCAATSSTWQQFTVADGSTVPDPAPTPRYRMSVEVVLANGHWAVTRLAPDPQHLCR